MSISRSQAELLASGFLDNIGDENTGLQPKETYTELFVLAGEFVDDAQTNLNNSNTNASGELSKSLVVKDPVQMGTLVQADVEMNFYGQFVNSGVRGTKSGQGKYAFKSQFPSVKMVSAIAEWQKQGKMKTFNANANKSVSRNEKKNASIGALDSAYATARSILQHGIKATGFIDKAVVKTESKISDRLGAALKIDIINSIT